MVRRQWRDVSTALFSDASLTMAVLMTTDRRNSFSARLVASGIRPEYSGGVRSIHSGGVRSIHSGGVRSIHGGGVRSIHSGGVTTNTTTALRPKHSAALGPQGSGSVRARRQRRRPLHEVRVRDSTAGFTHSEGTAVPAHVMPPPPLATNSFKING